MAYAMDRAPTQTDRRSKNTIERPVGGLDQGKGNDSGRMSEGNCRDYNGPTSSHGKACGRAAGCLKIVRPAYDTFYASLDSQQKARLDALGPGRHGWRW